MRGVASSEENDCKIAVKDSMKEIDVIEMPFVHVIALYVNLSRSESRAALQSLQLSKKDIFGPGKTSFITHALPRPQHSFRFSLAVLDVLLVTTDFKY